MGSRMKPAILVSCVASLLSHGVVRALRPAPFEPEYTREAPSGARLVSTNHGAAYGTEGVTDVYGPDGDLLYRMPVFAGRRRVDLSPDGSAVVFDGDVYFPTLMRPVGGARGAEDEVVTRVYLDGEPWRDVLYVADLGGPPTDPRRIMGGGWTRRPFSVAVDWDRGVLAYRMDEVADVEIALPRAPGSPKRKSSKSSSYGSHSKSSKSERGAGGDACRDDGGCGTDEYCKFDWGCGGGYSAGACAPTGGLDCPDGNAVCGCDGEDYDSACHAQEEGVNVDHYGPCTRYTRTSSRSSHSSSSGDVVRDSEIMMQ